MPKLINNFVLKCHPEKHERFASAGELLEPWKDVMDQVSVGAPPQSRAHREPFAEGIQQFYDDQPGTPTLGLNVGADVEIHALQKRPELNGVCGKIVKRQDDGRLQVKTATGEELALKPANLRPVSKLILSPGQVLSPEESQRLGFPPGAGLVLSTGEMLSREACQSMGLPPGSVILAVGAPPQPKPQHLWAGPDVRGQQQGQGVLRGMCIFCEAPVYDDQHRHSNAHGKFL